jgi:hypothetical protein
MQWYSWSLITKALQLGLLQPSTCRAPQIVVCSRRAIVKMKFLDANIKKQRTIFNTLLEALHENILDTEVLENVCGFLGSLTTASV